jgi:hypothetical protein
VKLYFWCNTQTYSVTRRARNRKRKRKFGRAFYAQFFWQFHFVRHCQKDSSVAKVPRSIPAVRLQRRIVLSPSSTTHVARPFMIIASLPTFFELSLARWLRQHSLSLAEALALCIRIAFSTQIHSIVCLSSNQD